MIQIFKGELQALSYIFSFCSFPKNTLPQILLFGIINWKQDRWSTEIFTKDIVKETNYNS